MTSPFLLPWQKAALLQAVPFINQPVQIREKNNVTDPLQTFYKCRISGVCYKQRANACTCIHVCLRKTFDAMKGQGTGGSPELWVAKRSCSQQSCQAREARTVVEPSPRAGLFSHSYVFHLCPWTEGALSAKEGGGRGSHLLRDNFWGFGNWTAYWGLDNTWEVTSVVLVWGNCPGASLRACGGCQVQRFASLIPAAEENWRTSRAISKMWTFLETLPWLQGQ